MFEYMNICAVFLARKPARLLPALLEQGLISALVSAICKMQTRPTYLQECSACRCIDLLVDYLRVHPGSAWIREALEGGLLQFVIQCSVDCIQEVQVDTDFLPALQPLLSEVLPRALVFYDIVVQMRGLLPKIEKLIAATPDFPNSTVAGQWTPFASLAKQRIVG
ncbi:hypothetical protein FB45DRAFT_1035046 [Roridomyces roridus]|uniref:Uncharacterized protein n=1 Tax=Roridomyces roridus TaxID=1738132 RepID=A0AAD7BBN7_9AGAR|nr:hypothetical protein FB45DRAFT_1035046 [Roridomyces roridus]